MYLLLFPIPTNTHIKFGMNGKICIFATNNKDL